MGTSDTPWTQGWCQTSFHPFVGAGVRIRSTLVLASPYSLGAAVLYGVFATWAAIARRRAISRTVFA
jgi:hypothetical protein